MSRSQVVRTLTAIAAVVLLAAGCAHAGAMPEPALTQPPDEFTSADAETVIDGTSHRIEVTAWRHVPADTSGGGLRCARLCVEIRVIADGEPAELEVVSVHAIRADGSAAFGVVEAERGATELTIDAERGPTTDEGSRIDIVLVLEDPTGARHLLRAYGVEVG